jgi:hypothetical protein
MIEDVDELETIKERLRSLSAEKMAAALGDMYEFSEDIQSLVDRLLASPTENMQRVKEQIDYLVSSEHFYHRMEAGHYVANLQGILMDIQAAAENPEQGMELISFLYKQDEGIYSNVDDSDDEVGSFYANEARLIFEKFARECGDKNRVIDILLSTLSPDNYGVRTALLENANDYLPEKYIRCLIDRLNQLSVEDDSPYGFQDNSFIIGMLARQLGDAKLFECIALESSLQTEPSIPTCLDIAEVYFESGDVESALGWISKVPEDDSFMQVQREGLLERIYVNQADVDSLTKLMFDRFKRHYSIDNLETLLEVIGRSRSEEIVQSAADDILGRESYNQTDVEFLRETLKIDHLERYVLKHIDNINGLDYYTWSPVAEYLGAEGRLFLASLIYRKLLESILSRGYSKAYHHGVDYLEKLDEYSLGIDSWKGELHHQDFKGSLRERYKLKRSFWAKYDV